MVDIKLSTRLDKYGAGYIAVGPEGESWLIDRVHIHASTAVREAVCSVYLNLIVDLSALTETASSGDSSSDVTKVRDGEVLFVVWTGGDPGATAYVELSGTSITSVAKDAV